MFMLSSFVERIYLQGDGADGLLAKSALDTIGSDRIFDDEDLEVALKEARAKWLDCKAKMLAFWQYLLVANRDGDYLSLSPPWLLLAFSSFFFFFVVG